MLIESFFQMTVDYEAGVCYVKLTDEDISYSKFIMENVFFDYDKHDKIVGIELWGDVEICDITAPRSDKELM